MRFLPKRPAAMHLVSTRGNNRNNIPPWIPPPSPLPLAATLGDRFPMRPLHTPQFSLLAARSCGDSRGYPILCSADTQRTFCDLYARIPNYEITLKYESNRCHEDTRKSDKTCIFPFTFSSAFKLSPFYRAHRLEFEIRAHIRSTLKGLRRPSPLSLFLCRANVSRRSQETASIFRRRN